ncbi:MAG TPA: FAD-dependent oxidoreductase [Candidatus Dormibacteraeota bacterium]
MADLLGAFPRGGAEWLALSRLTAVMGIAGYIVHGALAGHPHRTPNGDHHGDAEPMAISGEEWSMSRLRARVAIVGAGAVGLAVALQLRRAGVDGVVVLDRESSAGMGSTARANGGVRAQFATAVNIAFSQYTIPRLAELDELAGGKVGYRPVGYLLLAGDPSCATLHRDLALQRAMHLPVELASAQRVRELAPMVRVAGLRAAAFCASDGVIDPHGVARALWSEGARLGATYMFDTEVVAIESHGAGAVVHCARAEVEAEHVVNAAGAWARGLAALAGIDLPVLPYRRNLACTEPLPAVPASLPMCVDMDTGVLVRREGGGGLLVGWSDPDTRSGFETGFEPAFLEAVAARAHNRFPLLEQATVNPRKCWAGLYPETPDHNAVIDAPPSAPWFVQCAGFGGHGIMHSLAAGQAVTELVRDQRCSTFDISPLRLDRFDGPLTAETAWL